MRASSWRPLGVLTAACAVVVLAAACGGDSSSPSSPTPTPTPPPSGPPTATTTITLTASGVSPQNITVSPGSRVTFVNSDSRTHEMNSDPHPVHTDCPEINAVSFLAVGLSKQTDPLNTVRTCGFHDHNQPTTTSLQGTIRIQ
jgi:plastocyanin